MKKLMFIFLTLLLISPIISQDIISNDEILSQRIDFDYSIRAGVTTQYAANRDTMTILGALDTVVTRYWKNKGGDMSVQFQINNGTAVRLIIEVQAANGSEIFADSSFQTLYWIHWTGSDFACVKTAQDSVRYTGTAAYKKTIPIIIPPLGIDAFRLYIRSSSTCTGTPKIQGIILKRVKIS
jgi:hypothetical protein